MLIVDTNQAGLLPKPRRHVQRKVVLPELILAEILLHNANGRARTFKALRRYTLRLGVQPREVLDDIAPLWEDEIRQYRPFRTMETEFGRNVVRVLRDNRPTPGMLQWAQTAKDGNRGFMRWLNGAATQVRNRIRDEEIGKVDTFAQVSATARSLDSFIGSTVVSTTRNEGERTLRVADDAAFLNAVMDNPYLAHYFLGVLHYVTSVSRLWRTQQMNVDPIERRDDWTDLTLLLYVNDQRDVILSEDKFVRRVVPDVAPGVRIRTAAEL